MSDTGRVAEVDRALGNREPVRQLSRVPVRQRLLLALLIGPSGVVLLIGGLLVCLATTSLGGRLLGAAVAVAALLLVGVAQGLHRSARLDERAGLERELDAAILAGSASCGPASCGSASGGSSPGGSGGCGSASDGGSAPCAAADCAVRALPRR